MNFIDKDIIHFVPKTSNLNTFGIVPIKKTKLANTLSHLRLGTDFVKRVTLGSVRKVLGSTHSNGTWPQP